MFAKERRQAQKAALQLLRQQAVAAIQNTTIKVESLATATKAETSNNSKVGKQVTGEEINHFSRQRTGD
ncbi:MAG: hypothetical protein MZU97_02330 [Bacillus subtilis]|nr:hypothetical protein [Bacillus subtilis]